MDFKNLLATYNIGIIQTKAYKHLRLETSKALKPYELSATEWAVLGLIFEREGIRSSDLIEILYFKKPLLAKTILKLEKKDLIDKEEFSEDKRVKRLFLTKKSRELIPIIEHDVRLKMRDLISNITKEDFQIYLKVLLEISSS